MDTVGGLWAQSRKQAFHSYRGKPGGMSLSLMFMFFESRSGWQKEFRVLTECHAIDDDLTQTKSDAIHFDIQ